LEDPEHISTALILQRMKIQS